MTNALVKTTKPNAHRNEKTKVGWSVLTNLTVLTHRVRVYREPKEITSDQVVSHY